MFSYIGPIVLNDALLTLYRSSPGDRISKTRAPIRKELWRSSPNVIRYDVKDEYTVMVTVDLECKDIRIWNYGYNILCITCSGVCLEAVYISDVFNVCLPRDADA